MKFAQYLDRNAVEEWKKAYINYKGLKKLIKRVQDRHRRRLTILASLDAPTSERTTPAAFKATASRQRSETIAELRERVKVAQSRPAGQYGATGHSIDLAASPPPPHDLRSILLDNTGLRISQSVKDRLNSGKKNGQKDSRGQPGTTTRSGPGDDDGDGGHDADVEAGRVARGHDDDDQPPVHRKQSARERDVADQSKQKSATPSDTGSQQNCTVPAKSKSGNGAAANGGKKKKGKKEPVLSLDDYLAQYFDPSEKIFFLALDSELERITDFYEDRLAEAQVKFDELVHQLRQLSEHRRRWKEAEESGKREERPKWRHSIPFVNDVNFGKSQKGVTESQQKERSVPSDVDGRDQLETNDTATTSKGDKDKHDQSSGSDVDEGTRRRSKALKRMRQLAAEDEDEGVDEAPNANIVPSHRRPRDRRDHTHDPEKYKAARHKLKEAMAEFYRGLELIRSYKVLNKDGFGKILKKFDKTLEVSTSIPYFRSRIEPSLLVQSTRIEALLKSTEDAFTGFFEHGDRKRALDRLRMQGSPQNGLHTHHASASRTGFYLGVSVCAVVAGIVQMMRPDIATDIPSWTGLARIYGAMFLPVLFAVLFGLNLAAFAYGRINTAFIFEWDARHSLDYHQYFEVPSLLLLLLSLAFWVSFLNPFPDVIAPTTWPLVWIVVFLVLLLNPLPILHPRARSWFTLSVLRVFGAGFVVTGGVEFRDFFLGDELNSIAWSVSSLWFFGCEYQRDWRLPECDANGTYWTAFLSCVPALLRFGQCIRRWSDSKYSARIHLLNATKYATAVPHYFTYIHWRMSGSQIDGSLAMWVFFASIYSIFSMSWDILMDWSFFHPNARYPLLRNELVFEEVWPMYYFAIVSDVILRCNWIIYLLPGSASSVLRSFIVALLEVLRRFQWNFYRVGNEHQGNVDQYRALRDTPLPYHVPKPSSEEEEEEQQGGGFSVKLQKWRRKWTQSDAFDFQRAIDPTAEADAESEPEPEDDQTISRTHSALAAAGAAALDPLHAFAPTEARDESVVGRIQSFLVPDRGGYAARGPRLDEQSAAKGAQGRDYAPRAQEADADSDDAYTDDEDYGDGETDDGDAASSTSHDAPGGSSRQGGRQGESNGSGGGGGGGDGETGAGGSATGAARGQAIPGVVSSARSRDDAAARSLSKSWNRGS